MASYKTVVAGQEFTATWETVLAHEYNVRKQACKRVLYEDKDLAVALKEAMQDLQIKERWFITPIAVGAAAASSSSSGAALEAKAYRAGPYLSKDKGWQGRRKSFQG